MKYVDYRGDSIGLAAINIYDKDKGTNYTQNIIDDLSSQTGLSITVSSNGNLEYAKDKNGKPIISTTKDGDGNDYTDRKCYGERVNSESNK